MWEPRLLCHEKSRHLSGSCMHAKSFQSCMTLCSPKDCNLSGSSVHGILQAKILEWVAISSLGDLPNPGIRPVPLMSPALAGRSFTTSATWGAILYSGEGNGTPRQYSCLHWRRKWQPTPVFLPRESQGQGSLVGCHLWGRTKSDPTDAT